MKRQSLLLVLLVLAAVLGGCARPGFDTQVDLPAITAAIQGAGLQTCAEGELNWNLTAGFVEGKSVDVDTDCAGYDPNRPGARIHIARFDSAAARDAALRDFETTYRRHIGPAIGRAVGPWLILVDGHRAMPALERLRTALGQLAAQPAP